MTYAGIAKGKIIELAEELPLPDGTPIEVSISLPPTADTVRVTLECAGMLSDLTERQRVVFEEALARRPRFSRRLLLHFAFNPALESEELV